MRFAVAETFTRSLAYLDPVAQNQVKQKAFEFQVDPSVPGLHFHQVDRARDRRFWSFRVNDDLRVIVHKNGDLLVLCYVDRHDKAYAWGESRKIEQHPVTGVMQIVEVVEKVQETVRRVLVDVPQEASVLERFEPTYLRALGVPDEWMDAVRTVGEEGLLKLLDKLPPEVAERLMLLASGEPVPVPELAAPAGDAFRQPDTARVFRVLDGQEDLRSALDAPWEKWIIYLHPAQQALVDRRFRGPARVTGGAGTGKTVVAVHRALSLLRRSSTARVLLTTFSKTLASRLDRQVGLIANHELKARLTVEHVHRLATRLAGGRASIVDGKTLTKFVAEVSSAGGATDPRVLRTEFEQVVDPWGVTTLEEYLQTPRRGRGMALNPAARRKLWGDVEQLRARLEAAKVTTWSGICHAARRQTTSPQFEHVVVDEAQDLGPAEMSFLRALVRVGEDDMFLCSDAGQRIYRLPFVWTAAGVDVRGRSARLRLNYRTTHQIKRYADAVLPEEVDEGEKEFERRLSISVLSGPSPEVLHVDSFSKEKAGIERWLDDVLQKGIAASEVAIFSRTETILRERVVPAIEEKGIRHSFLTEDGEASRTAVALGSMHRAKGLEFRAVAIVGCEDGTVPLRVALQGAYDEDHARVILAQERALLYVALTRARERLLVTSVGTPSPLLGR